MRWLSKLVNKQVLRAFSFNLSTLRWEEVAVEDVRNLFKRDLEKMGLDDRASYCHKIDGKVVEFIVVFYCNENKKDSYYVKSILTDTLYKCGQTQA